MFLFVLISLYYLSMCFECGGNDNKIQERRRLRKTILKFREKNTFLKL